MITWQRASYDETEEACSLKSVSVPTKPLSHHRGPILRTSSSGPHPKAHLQIPLAYEFED
jgi:hypothetical protein